MAIVNLGQPYGYGDMVRDVERLEAAYPFLQRLSIGQSVLGRELPALRLGCGRKSVFVNAAFHANEWITTPMVLRVLERFAQAVENGERFRGENLTELFQRTTLWIVPMVNPDGVELVHRGAAAGGPYASSLLEWNEGSPDFSLWKANVRGVDLNDQFPAYWEEERKRRSPSGPGPRDYAGPSPLSEPEAAAVAAFTRAQDFDIVVAFHTQGREIYWNYRDAEPPDAEAIAEAMAAECGYEPVKLTGSDAGFKDWFILTWGRPGFTVESGFGVNPLPLAQLPGLVSEASGIILRVMLATCECN